MKNNNERICACIDIGSNMFRMIISKNHHNSWQIIKSFAWAISIGSHNGTIDQNAINRIMIGAGKAKDLLASYQNVKIFCVATAAIRSASNGDEIVQMLFDRYDIPCRIIDPGVEIMLSGSGCKDIFLNGLSLFIDMGGGSTEIGLFKKTFNTFHVIAWISLPYGLFYCSQFSHHRSDWIPPQGKRMLQKFATTCLNISRKNMPLVLCKSGIVGFITSYLARIESVPKTSFHGSIFEKHKLYKIMDTIINMKDVDIVKNNIANHISCISSIRGSMLFTKQIMSMLPVDFVIVGNGGVKEGILMLL